jgi:hypothetical protein
MHVPSNTASTSRFPPLLRRHQHLMISTLQRLLKQPRRKSLLFSWFPWSNQSSAFAVTNDYFIHQLEIEHCIPREFKSKLRDIGSEQFQIGQSIFSGNGVFLIIYLGNLLLIGKSKMESILPQLLSPNYSRPANSTFSVVHSPNPPIFLQTLTILRSTLAYVSNLRRCAC